MSISISDAALAYLWIVFKRLSDFVEHGFLFLCPVVASFARQIIRYKESPLYKSSQFLHFTFCQLRFAKAWGRPTVQEVGQTPGEGGRRQLHLQLLSQQQCLHTKHTY